MKVQLILMDSWNELSPISSLTYCLSDKHVWELNKIRHLILMIFYYCGPRVRKSNMLHRPTWSYSVNVAILWNVTLTWLITVTWKMNTQGPNIDFSVVLGWRIWIAIWSINFKKLFAKRSLLDFLYDQLKFNDREYSYPFRRKSFFYWTILNSILVDLLNFQIISLYKGSKWYSNR